MTPRDGTTPVLPPTPAPPARRRRSHRHLLHEQLRQGRLRWLFAASQRVLRLKLGLPSGGPLFATLAVTWRCNYRCTFCDLPDRAHGDPPLATLVARLRELRRRGTLAVGITGGEPLLHPQLFELLDEARRLGLLVHLNTNGSRLTEREVPALLAAGLHSINLSLDGAEPATHDAMRRVPGSFDQIRATVAALLSGRSVRDDRRDPSPRVALIMVVTPANRTGVRGFAALAREWGCDGAGFLPHHEFAEPRAPLSGPEAAELARELAALDPLVDNSPAYLRGLARFLAGDATPTACSAGRSHVAVDPDGTSYPCVPLMTLRRAGVPLIRVGPGDGSRDGPAATGIRAPRPSAQDIQEVCRRCWWNCHRELDLSLRIITNERPPPAPG